MRIDAEFLLSRLPAFYRERDAQMGGPLRALLEVIAEQGEALEADIARLYDNWFIETCDDWLIPYIGDLLGVRGLHAVTGTRTFGGRGYVANTLRMRRRKGTVPVLEQLAFDTTGWRARAVEFFELLATTQHLNHRRIYSLRTPNLRDAAALERVDGPFDRSSHTAEVRPLPSGRYNIPNVGLFLWRLQAYALQRSTASVATSQPGFYSFDPLGPGIGDGPGLLFNRPRTETEITHLAEPINVPEPLSRRLLHDELTALRQAIADGETPRLLYFAEDAGGPVLRIWLDDVEIPPQHLVVCNLSPLPGVIPEEWRRPPVSLTVKSGKSGRPDTQFPSAPGEFLVGFDPVLGRLALPAGKTAAKVEVAYAYGFPGDIGGGPYDRRPARPTDDDANGLLKTEDFDAVLTVPGDHPTLAAALAAVSAGSRTLVRLLDDASWAFSPNLNLPDTHLAIEAANQRRPVLIGEFRLRGNSNTRLSLSGLLLHGQLRLQGALRSVNLRHCSVTPDGSGIRHTGTGSELAIGLIHCLCGPVKVSNAIASVTAANCVFDNGENMALDLPDTALSLDRCTVFGATSAGELEGSNCLFTRVVNITRKQQGCVRFCYVPPNSVTPRRYRCQPDLVMQGLTPALAKAEQVRVIPAFTSTRFGHSAYGQLRLSTAPEIRTGADDGAEMGVWNLLQQPQREANLRLALEEYLRFGLEAGIIFVN